MKEKKFDRREKLIATALDEFTENEYEKASLNTIIKNAGISKGVFYYHFANKEALYLALLEDANQKKWQYIQQTMTDNQDKVADMTIFDQFLYQARISSAFATIYPKYHQLARMFSKEKDNPIYQVALEKLEHNDSHPLEIMVHTAYENGEIRTDFDVSFVNALLSHLFSEFDTIFDLDGRNDLDAVIKTLEKYVDFIKHGLAASTVS